MPACPAWPRCGSKRKAARVFVAGQPSADAVAARRARIRPSRLQRGHTLLRDDRMHALHSWHCLLVVGVRRLQCLLRLHSPRVHRLHLRQRGLQRMPEPHRRVQPRLGHGQRDVAGALHTADPTHLPGVPHLGSGRWRCRTRNRRRRAAATPPPGGLPRDPRSFHDALFSKRVPQRLPPAIQEHVPHNPTHEPVGNVDRPITPPESTSESQQTTTSLPCPWDLRFPKTYRVRP